MPHDVSIYVSICKTSLNKVGDSFFVCARVSGICLFEIHTKKIVTSGAAVVAAAFSLYAYIIVAKYIPVLILVWPMRLPLKNSGCDSSVSSTIGVTEKS